MRDALVYRDKAEVLLEKFKTLGYNPNTFTDQPEVDEVIDEFLHLVYFFDKDMPLYGDMIGSDDTSHRNLNAGTMEYYVGKFIHYLDEYCID